MAYYNNQAILIRGSLADGAAIDHDDGDDCDGFDDDERKDNNDGDDYYNQATFIIRGSLADGAAIDHHHNLHHHHHHR